MTPVKITNKFLGDVQWTPSSQCNYVLAGDTHIFKVGINSNASHLESFAAMLNSQEIKRAARYLQLHDKNRFITARGATRLILGKYLNVSPEAIEFEIGNNKKPFVKNAQLFYNVSHSGDRIVLAVSKSAVGIDTEQINRDFDFNDIIAEYFSPEEARLISETDSHSRFFRLWTRKEALTKATGKGLDEDLKFIPALDGEHSIQNQVIGSAEDWLTGSFRLDGENIASVSVSVNCNKLTFFEGEF